MRRAYQRYAPRNDRSRPAEGAPPLQLSLNRQEVLQQLQEGLHAFGVMLGVEVAKLFMNEEVERLCGARYEHRTEREATRHGWQPGVITIGGQKLPVRRPTCSPLHHSSALRFSATRCVAQPRAIRPHAAQRKNAKIPREAPNNGGRSGYLASRTRDSDRVHVLAKPRCGPWRCRHVFR